MEELMSIGSENDEGLYRYSAPGIILLTISYILVFCLGVLGNSSVLFVISKTPQMRTVTNIYVANLAVADLLVILFCLPPTLISNIYVPWILGWFLCKTVPYIQGISVCASVYSLVAISMDRFLTIWFPLRVQVHPRHTSLVIFTIWISSALLMLPWAFFFNTTSTYPSHPETEFCIESWPDNLSPTLYFIIANLLLTYLVPLLLISLCYFFIWVRVWRRYVPSDSDSFSSARASHMDLVHQRAKVSVLKMVLVVVLVFALCWLPLYGIFVRIKLGPSPLSAREEEFILFVMPFAQWLGSSASCVNPILYGFLNPKFRRVFITLLRKIWMRRERSEGLLQVQNYKKHIISTQQKQSLLNTMV